MESSEALKVEKPPSLPPNYVSLAQLQQQWLQRKEEKRLAEERQQEEERMAEERRQEEERLAEERRRNEESMAEERRQREKRMAEEWQRKAEERQIKERRKLSEMAPRERRVRGAERVQWWRRVDGIHCKSEELTGGAPAVAAVGNGKKKNGNWEKQKKNGARVSGNLIEDEKCGARAEFGDKGFEFEGKVQIAEGLLGIDAPEGSGGKVGGGGSLRKVDRRRGAAPMNGKTEGVSMKEYGRLKEKIEMKSQAFDVKEIVSGDPSEETSRDLRRKENVVGEGGSVTGNGWRKKKIEKGSQAFDDKEIASVDSLVKTRRDSRCEENVVEENGSVTGSGWRKKKPERGFQAFGDKEMVSGNQSMKTVRDLSSECVALRKVNEELFEAGTEDNCSVHVGRKRGERSKNRYKRKSVDAKESEIELRCAVNVAEIGVLLGENETGKAKTEKELQAFGDRVMVSDNQSTKIIKDSVEESSGVNMPVKKGKHWSKIHKRKAAIGDRDREVVRESKGKEVTLQGDEGSKEVHISVAGNGDDQARREVVSERRRGGGSFRVKADRRVKLGVSKESKVELGLEENVGRDEVLAKAKEGQVGKTEMGSLTNRDGVFSLEVVHERKGKEVTLQGDEGSKEVQIPVAGNGDDQRRLEVVSERRRSGGRFRVKVDRRVKLGDSRESEVELGLEENVGMDGVLAKGKDGKVWKTEMGSLTNGDADVVLGNTSAKIRRDLSSLLLNEDSGDNVAWRRKYHGWQRQKFGKPRAAAGVTGPVWVKKLEISEPSLAEAEV